MDGEAIIKEAMKKAKNNWMRLDEGNQFNCACAIAYSQLNDDDKPRLQATLDVMKIIEAASRGVPVDMVTALDHIQGIECFPLKKWWDETK